MIKEIQIFCGLKLENDDSDGLHVCESFTLTVFNVTQFHNVTLLDWPIFSLENKTQSCLEYIIVESIRFSREYFKK